MIPVYKICQLGRSVGHNCPIITYNQAMPDLLFPRPAALQSVKKRNKKQDTVEIHYSVFQKFDRTIK